MYNSCKLYSRVSSVIEAANCNPSLYNLHCTTDEGFGYAVIRINPSIKELTNSKLTFLWLVRKNEASYIYKLTNKRKERRAILWGKLGLNIYLSCIAGSTYLSIIDANARKSKYGMRLPTFIHSWYRNGLWYIPTFGKLNCYPHRNIIWVITPYQRMEWFFFPFTYR